MNLIAFIFGLLLIFTCSFSLSLRKFHLTEPIDSTYRANAIASQKILNSYESLRYKRIPKKKSAETEKKKQNRNQTTHQHDRTQNGACARLNLWPLIQEGRETHPALYQTAVRIFKTFYTESPELFLNALLEAAKMQLKKDSGALSFSLEKLALGSLQLTYYQMLKGAMKAPADQRYPSLLELITLEKTPSLICLQHTSQPLLNALFTAPLAEQILLEKEELKKDQLRELCLHKGQRVVDDEFLNLFDLQQTSHRISENQTILVQDENEVSLKKKVFFAS